MNAFFPLLATSLISGLFGQSNQDAYLRAQSRENDRAFQRNRQLAQEQNEYNIQQWNRENRYNLPVNQMERLRDAGINPDMAFSNGVSGLTAANSPSMSAGSPYQPVDYTMNGQRKTIGDTISQSLDLAMKKAQIDNINANTNKTSNENTLLELTMNNVVELSSADLRLRLEQIDFTKAQTDKFIAETEAVKTGIDEINSRIAKNYADIENMTFEQLARSMEITIQKNLTDATIAKIKAETNLTEQEILRVAKIMPLEISKLEGEVRLVENQADLADRQISVVNEEVNLKIAEASNINADTEYKKELTNKVKIESEDADTIRSARKDAFRVWQDMAKINKINVIQAHLFF